MDAADSLSEAWVPYEREIRECLLRLSVAPMPEDADFLWLVLIPEDLRGMPVMAWPTERNQQQHDGWKHEDDLWKCVPESVELPDELTGTVEGVDQLRDACAMFLATQWQTLDSVPRRLAYFSIHDDGWYFSLRDGRRISAWDIENEISEHDGGANS